MTSVPKEGGTSLTLAATTTAQVPCTCPLPVVPPAEEVLDFDRFIILVATVGRGRGGKP